jgi:hypothetical protein
LDVGVDLLFFATRAAKVNDPDVSFTRFAKQDILGFQVAVNDVLLLQQEQASHHLAGKATDQREGESLEIVCTNELVEVDRQAWRDDAKMRAEVE